MRTDLQVDRKPVAIIDIGSNSVRLVVYAGAPRIPSIIFNEKVMAGLGKGLAKTGQLSEGSQERALAAMRRFRILVREMGAGRTRVVATAAVRDASNGAAFLDKVRALGFKPEILSGEEEGRMAGFGVLSAIPRADGIIGDLGGGSLELVDVEDGEIISSISLPFGVLRLQALCEKGDGELAKTLNKAIAGFGFRKRGKGRPFYMVGGSWRTLARLDMMLTGYPLPITHEYHMAPERPAELSKTIAGISKEDVESVHSLSLSRVPQLPYANMLLRALVDELRPSELIVSSFGIREGLLYDDLDRRTRAVDPLLAAAREAGRGLGRFAEHGELLDRWISPLFADDAPATARLRLAACLLADVAWRAHPDFRAERGLDMALHGNWVGIDGPGRVMMAQALYCNFGGSDEDFSNLDVARLCSKERLHRASLWGLAMRLGQRFSGGVAASLERSRLYRKGDMLRLELKKGDEALFGESVERRLKTLANALGCPFEAVAV
ncbi:MAG TPA: Ppx/GppA family phosphatase [Allosphingosinicella sp.]|uniref:Ppx/GppA family phosphatase n=1 Tax=Allosphingosinicella sp. TaxID=2823234 RepID=UPI002EDB8968